MCTKNWDAVFWRKFIKMLLNWNLKKPVFPIKENKEYKFFIKESLSIRNI